MDANSKTPSNLIQSIKDIILRIGESYPVDPALLDLILLLSDKFRAKLEQEPDFSAGDFEELLLKVQWLTTVFSEFLEDRVTNDIHILMQVIHDIQYQVIYYLQRKLSQAQSKTVDPPTVSVDPSSSQKKLLELTLSKLNQSRKENEELKSQLKDALKSLEQLKTL